MQVSFGYTEDDNKKVSKTYSAAVTLEAKVLEPCSVLNPTFIVTSNAALLTSNYAYCSTFGRYYYITDIVIDSGGRMQISCKVDVLMSYRDGIRQLITTVTRNENADSGQQVDSQIVTTPKSELSFIKLMNTNVFNIRGAASYNYVLCIAGGATGGEGGEE